MPDALKIAIVGAESTGKSTLALALADALAEQTGLRCVAVPEWLRTWCEQEGRTPLQAEQRGILRTQHAQIEDAARDHDIVVCDTTALTTAVYSQFLFDDGTLDEEACRLHRGMALTLLTAIDLPWVGDGLQRDGEQVREPVDQRLRRMLLASRVDWSIVAGAGPQRLQSALDAVAPLVRSVAAPRRGLFTRLQARDASAPPWPWSCDCDDPGCEHATQALRRG